MNEAYICNYLRTPVGKFAGSLASVRTDDLAAIPIREIARQIEGKLDQLAIDDVIIGCANQAGEDNRNIARMALLLAGLPISVPGVTINRLCASGMSAVIAAAQAIRCGQAQVIIAGGVESMSRAPFVIPKSQSPFSRNAEIYDTTLGWRFVNPLIEEHFGVDSMPQTAQNVAEHYGITREDQDAFALKSQENWHIAHQAGIFKDEIVPVEISADSKSSSISAVRKGVFDVDEHPRQTNLESLSKLKSLFGRRGTVTAGNCSGINDGAAAMIIASEKAVNQFDLTPVARVLGSAAAGVEPRLMGIGPVPATHKLCNQLNLIPDQFGIVEVNEAFAAQCLAVLRELGVDEKSPHVNPNGGAIALGHPLGMSGARIVGTAALEMNRKNIDRALVTMCVGVGQGVSIGLGSP